MYLPFGQVRTDVGNISQTDFGYTGQRALDNGLMDYHARFYDPYLNRWTQPDSIVPDPSNPQSLDRYIYANNNPIKYNDPSGQCIEDFCIVEVIALVGLTISMSQVPSDLAQSNPDRQGNQDVFVGGLAITAAAPDIAALAGEGLMGLGKLISNPKVFAMGKATYDAATVETEASLESSGYKIRSPLKVAKDYKIDPESSPVTNPYVRPSYSVTDEQRVFVQNKPCAFCGQITDNQVVDHKTPLSIEYYKTGSIDIGNMRNIKAIQPSCASCSASQGAELSWFSKFMRGILFRKR